MKQITFMLFDFVLKNAYTSHSEATNVIRFIGSETPGLRQLHSL